MPSHLHVKACKRCRSMVIDNEFQQKPSLLLSGVALLARVYLNSLRRDMFFSESFFMTFATAISKSSCKRHVSYEHQGYSTLHTNKVRARYGMTLRCQERQVSHLCDMHPPFPQSEHASLRAACLHETTTRCQLCCSSIASIPNSSQCAAQLFVQSSIPAHSRHGMHQT